MIISMLKKGSQESQDSLKKREEKDSESETTKNVLKLYYILNKM